MIWVSVIWSVFQVYKLLYYIQSQHCWLLVNRKLFTTTTFKPCLVLGCYCTCICCAQLPHWAMPFSFAAILHWDQSKWPVCTNKCMTILFNSLRSWVSFIAHTHTHARTHTHRWSMACIPHPCLGIHSKHQSHFSIFYCQTQIFTFQAKSVISPKHYNLTGLEDVGTT